MPCKDSSSSLWIKLDPDERFVTFQFAKVTCSSEINGQTGYARYLSGKTLNELLAVTYQEALSALKITEEEPRFILHLEWDALRAAICQYLGYSVDGVDHERCKINSIEFTDLGIEIALIVLPPKELPQIIACGLKSPHDREP